jgi:hypothetical protein
VDARDAGSRDFRDRGVSLLALEEPARPPRSLEQKMQRFQRQAEKWQRVSRIMKDFQPLVEQGRFADAEALLDKALSVLDAEPRDPGNLEDLDQFRREADETQYVILPSLLLGPPIGRGRNPHR